MILKNFRMYRPGLRNLLSLIIFVLRVEEVSVRKFQVKLYRSLINGSLQLKILAFLTEKKGIKF